MDPQSRRTRNEYCKRVHIERNETAENREYHWIPLQCRKKMAVKELDAASRHSACEAGQLGKIMKHAPRPGQAHG